MTSSPICGNIVAVLPFHENYGVVRPVGLALPFPSTNGTSTHAPFLYMMARKRRQEIG